MRQLASSTSSPVSGAVAAISALSSRSRRARSLASSPFALALSIGDPRRSWDASYATRNTGKDPTDGARYAGRTPWGRWQIDRYPRGGPRDPRQADDVHERNDREDAAEQPDGRLRRCHFRRRRRAGGFAARAGVARVAAPAHGGRLASAGATDALHP